jgi:hypothetical protein
MSDLLGVGAVYQMNIALNRGMQKQQYQGKHEIEAIVKRDSRKPGKKCGEQ